MCECIISKQMHYSESEERSSSHFLESSHSQTPSGYFSHACYIAGAYLIWEGTVGWTESSVHVLSQNNNEKMKPTPLKDFVSNLVVFQAFKKAKYFQWNRYQILAAILTCRLKWWLQPPFVKVLYYNLRFQSCQHNNIQILPWDVLSLYQV